MADPSTLVGKSSLSDIAEVISATSSLLWPLIAIAVFWLLRDRMAELIRLAIKRIETATDIEFGAIKIKGAVVSQARRQC